MLSDTTRQKETSTMCFHLHIKSKIIKLKEAESRKLVGVAADRSSGSMRG